MMMRAATRTVATRSQEATWLRRLASLDAEATYAQLSTRRRGLSSSEVQSSREKGGPNEIAHAPKPPLVVRFLGSFVDPFIAILVFIGIVSVMTDVVLAEPGTADPATPVLIGVMVLASGVMRFVQETRGGDAAEALARTIQTTCAVERDGVRSEVPLSDVVVGDVVHLAAGDIIPADARVVAARDLFVSQSALTGESEPLEKVPAAWDGAGDLADSPCLVFMGTTVVSGTGICVVCAVGQATMFGSIARGVGAKGGPTAHEQGLRSVSMLFLRLMLVVTPIVFVACGLTKGDWMSSLLFALSVAVGLTPEMLPMIVSTCLAKGARDLADERVIAKRLDAVQNLGAIDLLCCDKTGTLTENRVVLERHINVDGDDDERVLMYGFLNSAYETGLRNLIDQAIIDRAEELDEDWENLPQVEEILATWHLVDELPFDYERRRVSVVVGDDTGSTTMITKGAIEEVLAVCSRVERDGREVPLTDEQRTLVLQRAADLADDGMRVLGVARREDPEGVRELDADDERDLVLIGYLAFLDPPKADAAKAVAALDAHGVDVKVLTGDSARVAACVCRSIGIDGTKVLSGEEVEAMSDAELVSAAAETGIFAKLAPDQKARVVTALRSSGRVVGFMGDGVNDAAAMKVADCGISVDTGADVAKEAADIVLLEKDLMVLERGVVQCRRTSSNMAKYVRLAAGGNFGNVFSVMVASLFLPFLPMLAIQVLLLNLMNDLVSATIPWDGVDPEEIARPRTLDVLQVSVFMRRMGPVSSVFDVVTFAVMFFLVCPRVCGGTWAELASVPEARAWFVALFQAGWFVESLVTQVLAIHLLRTRHAPFVESRAALPLALASVVACVAAVLIPGSPVGAALDFVAIPAWALLWIGVICLGYAVVTLAVRRSFE